MEQEIPQKRENYIGVLDTLRGFLAFDDQSTGYILLNIPADLNRELTIQVFPIRGWVDVI